MVDLQPPPDLPITSIFKLGGGDEGDLTEYVVRAMNYMIELKKSPIKIIAEKNICDKLSKLQIHRVQWRGRYSSFYGPQRNQMACTDRGIEEESVREREEAFLQLFSYQLAGQRTMLYKTNEGTPLFEFVIDR